MKVSIIGLGRVGSIAASELKTRGHYVVGIDKIADESEAVAGSYEVYVCEVSKHDEMVKYIKGSDAVFSTIPPDLEHPEIYKGSIQAIIQETKDAGVPRLLSIIGSSSAMVNTGQKLLYTDILDETNRLFFENICEAETVYHEEKNLDWACITPPAFMELYEPVLRKYRKRYDNYIVTMDDTSMKYTEVSRISLTDFAYACCDEIENPTAHHQRICVGY